MKVKSSNKLINLSHGRLNTLIFLQSYGWQILQEAHMLKWYDMRAIECCQSAKLHIFLCHRSQDTMIRVGFDIQVR